MQKKGCSEDLFLKEEVLTTRTPRTSRTSLFCSRRRSVCEALFKKNCFRRNVSEDLILKELLLTSDIPDIPEEAVKQLPTIVFKQ